ncbi:unnamed protein product [Staurois parvus]|uniref:Secreted protein n=1 Tax=Staurois parvus TaxID=386267 RepID=A0ABN9F9R9_9NEOB|nr:unnamed protein product [Staurois parvus]
MGPVRLLMLLARPLICHGPLYRHSSCCCQVQSVSWVPVRPHCCCLHRHTLPCATFRSPHTAGGFHFCHRVLFMASHCCCLHRHTVAPHSGFGPVTAQM